jgi:hypothetical protein
MMYSGKIPIINSKAIHWANIDYIVPHHKRTYYEPLKWFDNCVIQNAQIHIVDMARGRSAAYFKVEINSSIQATMFMTDLLHIIKEFGIALGGNIESNIEFCKRGQNYGVKASHNDGIPFSAFINMIRQMNIGEGGQ